MRRVVISLVSLWAVLWHTYVGCCAHHEHSLARGAGPLIHCTAGHHHDSGTHHDHGMPPADPIAPPSHDDCHESHCHAVLAGSVAAPDVGGPVGWLPAAVATDEFILGSSHPNCVGLAFNELRPLPLRAHLRFAVLLI